MKTSNNPVLRQSKLTGMLALSLSSLALAAPAQALTIIPTFDSSITSAPNASQIESTINDAIHFYSAFDNPATVSINFRFQSAGSLGSSSFPLYARSPV